MCWSLPVGSAPGGHDKVGQGRIVGQLDHVWQNPLLPLSPGQQKPLLATTKGLKIAATLERGSASSVQSHKQVVIIISQVVQVLLKRNELKKCR